MNPETAISVHGLTKIYKLYNRAIDRLKEVLNPAKKIYHKTLCALDDVSFDIKRGETVGIVGRNGAGKSTLLQILSGVLAKTGGDVRVDGKIAPLLELGAGFNPYYTGRENVFLNAAIMGLSTQEIEARYRDITDFADIGEFMERPVRIYSSGMYLRLAFAVAANVDADILIIDEALAVGDAAFQRKCYKHMENMCAMGKTVLLATHNLHTLTRLCSSAILFERGRKLLHSTPKEVANTYQRLLFDENQNASPETSNPPMTENEVCAPGDIQPKLNQPGDLAESSYGNNQATIVERHLLDENGAPTTIVRPQKKYIFKYTVVFHDDIDNIDFGMVIKTVDGVRISGSTAHMCGIQRSGQIKRGETRVLSFSFIAHLTPGNYYFQCGVTKEDGTVLHRRLDTLRFHVEALGSNNCLGLANLDINCAIADKQ